MGRSRGKNRGLDTGERFVRLGGEGGTGGEIARAGWQELLIIRGARRRWRDSEKQGGYNSKTRPRKARDKVDHQGTKRPYMGQKNKGRN